MRERRGCATTAVSSAPLLCLCLGQAAAAGSPVAGLSLAQGLSIPSYIHLHTYMCIYMHTYSPFRISTTPAQRSICGFCERMRCRVFDWETALSLLLASAFSFR